MSYKADHALLESLRTARNLHELEHALADLCSALGFNHFAIVQHIDFANPSARGFRLHNYPQRWVDWFDSHGLGVTDPIHRASHRTLGAFRWAMVPSMIPLSARDRQVLDMARSHGLVDGLTVPAHIPGELLASCSFSTTGKAEIDESLLLLAQLAGQCAFEASRRLTGTRQTSDTPLTSRQLECIMYVGRGKTDAEIAQILGVSENTVVEHLKNARHRYNASGRAVLPVRALYDGALSFADVLTG